MQVRDVKTHGLKNSFMRACKVSQVSNPGGGRVSTQMAPMYLETMNILPNSNKMNRSNDMLDSGMGGAIISHTVNHRGMDDEDEYDEEDDNDYDQEMDDHHTINQPGG